MNILVPFKHPDFVDNFITAGAQEFYLGFYDPKFIETFGDYADINRMTGFKSIANPFDFKTAVEQIKKIKNAGGNAFITLNANCYSPEMLDFFEKNYLKELAESGVDGVIISDLLLLPYLKAFNLNPVLSTMCGIYNSEIAKFWFNKGVKRMIVPRDLSLKEIATIKTELPEMDLEVFFMRNGCIFSDGYCLGTHRSGHGATCAFIRQHSKRFMTKEKDFYKRMKADENNDLYNNHFHSSTCGLCALPRLKKMGVTALKIVGRSDNPKAILDDINLIKENLDILEESNNETEFLENMTFPPDRTYRCLNGLCCYYPEVRFNKKKISF